MIKDIPIVPSEEVVPREKVMKIIEKKERKERKEYIKKLEEAMEGWRFIDTTIKQMKKLNNKTKAIGIEHSSLLCGDNKTKKIGLYNECVGTKCSVRVEYGRCPNNKNELGVFHTHPGSRVSRFSATDIFGGEKLSCLGTPDAIEENEKLMCVVPTKESLKHKRLMRRTNELIILESKSDSTVSKLEHIVEDEYGYLRDIDEIIEDDYYKFNPEEYKNIKKR